jgi:ubiquinone/menaquinone biosynthesis C-methylase UbiE
MTQPVDYDFVAAAYDKRYETHRFDAVESVLKRFIGDSGCADAAEVGCGTGHWLATLRGRVRTAAGLDLSAGMLQRARTKAPFALVVRGSAEHLPWAAGRFDRLFCINAMHHFSDADAFMTEARRVLRPDGALLIIGLDPHIGLDQWWLYDYFPAALKADRARYLATATIRRRLEAIGFEPATELAQHICSATPFAVAIERGLIDRCATSQLMVISSREYEDGLHRLKAEQPILRADLRLYATVGWVRPPSCAAGHARDSSS